MTTMSEQPQFHIVVRRPDKRGPLAPYRFALTVGFALALTGRSLWAAAMTGVGIDHALTIFGLVALLAWFVVGRISSILGAATPSSDRSDAPSKSPPTMPRTDDTPSSVG
jgi:hypothetical protein